MEEKLSGLLNDPDAMGKLLSMARSLGASSSPEPSLNPQLVQGLQGLGSAVDPDQRALLDALCPYLSQSRVSRLEKAMRAAKMARFASAFLSNGGAQLLMGR